MKQLILILLLSLIPYRSIYSQFHDYSVKYGIQAHLMQPSTEFDNDAYRLSLFGRGFLRIELNSYLETELGVGIGELNGKDPNNKNWSTLIFPTDLRLVFSPFASNNSSPYIYSGLGLLKWNLSDLPSITNSQNPSEENGWNLSIPLGGGIEIKLSEEILLDISGGYTFALTDDLNFYNSPDVKDGFFDLGIGLTFVMGGSLTDRDNDGLTQKFENMIGTNPEKRDTDGDNLLDGDEYSLYKTNPLLKDSDRDGLNDFDEIKRYNSDPNSIDTDGDDLTDFDEVITYNSNPTIKDSDSDNLTDGYEVNVYNTNPSKNDSDTDQLFDNDELQKYKTDPNNPDTDGDGLLDGEEILKYNTNPLLKDSQGVKSANIEKILKINENKPTVLDGITFETDKDEINPESEVTLNKTFLILKNNPTLSVEIKGYTDNVGNASYNKKLSQQRAEAVRIWLVKKGIDALRIKASGYGELNPIADNNHPEGRVKNRRIEIIKINK
jgi:outer membrane protein OmpA-like peptidoglycan-associated protein